jgi:hypothetical protein
MSEMNQNARGGDLVAPYVCAALLPIIGVIWGMVFLSRDRIGPGLGVITASGVAWIVWMAILYGGA